MKEPDFLQAIALLLLAAMSSSAPNQAGYAHNQIGLASLESPETTWNLLPDRHPGRHGENPGQPTQTRHVARQKMDSYRDRSCG